MLSLECILMGKKAKCSVYGDTFPRVSRSLLLTTVVMAVPQLSWRSVSAQILQAVVSTDGWLQRWTPFISSQEKLLLDIGRSSSHQSVSLFI